MTDSRALADMNQYVLAAKNADWLQVVLNQGPPCFFFERDSQKFCLRAQRWMGHHDEPPTHHFVSLEDMLLAFVSHDAAQREEIATLKERLKEALEIGIDWLKPDATGVARSSDNDLARIYAIRAEVFGQEGK